MHRATTGSNIFHTFMCSLIILLTAKIPEFVHVVPCPDLYRGKHRETDTKAVDKYCQEARDVMTGAVAKDRKVFMKLMFNPQILI
jgi:hypothetical protein